jgi:rare lipoprotein A (peptidoglycan hydrolase)
VRPRLARDRVLFIALIAACLVALLIVRDATAATSRASSFGPGLYGNTMACGGTLWPSTRAVAHRRLPCGTRIRVCYATSCVNARVRDRGPYVRHRTLDLSEALVRELGYPTAVVWGVRVVVWRQT